MPRMRTKNAKNTNQEYQECKTIRNPLDPLERPNAFPNSQACDVALSGSTGVAMSALPASLVRSASLSRHSCTAAGSAEVAVFPPASTKRPSRDMRARLALRPPSRRGSKKAQRGPPR
eukprot:7666738-Pyramimonas_sp.AAC.2